MHFQSTNIAPTQLPTLYGIQTPVTSGGFQIHIDPMGDPWVAKPGVFGGSWNKPADVLHARWYVAANFSIPNIANVAVPYDTMRNDPYGMFNNSTNMYTTPMSGIYRFYGQVDMIPTASGQYVNCMLRQNGTRVAQTQSHGSSTNAGIYAYINDTVLANAGDTFYMESYTLPNALTGGGGSHITFFGVDYLGHGE